MYSVRNYFDSPSFVVADYICEYLLAFFISKFTLPNLFMTCNILERKLIHLTKTVYCWH